MRLSPEIVNFIKQLISDKIPGATVYLFGSRVNDLARGGDIDLMIMTNEPADKRALRRIRLEFFKKFGWQKIDLVNFTPASQSAFQQLIMSECIPL